MSLDLSPVSVETEFNNGQYRHVVYIYEEEVWASEWDTGYFTYKDDIEYEWREKWKKFQVESFKAWMRDGQKAQETP